MDKGLASAKIYRQAGVQWLKNGLYSQFVTSQPCGAHPWGSIYCTQKCNSVGSDGSDPGSVLEVQAKAVGDRARDRDGDNLQRGSEKSIQKTSCLQQRSEVQLGDIQRQDWSLTHL